MLDLNKIYNIDALEGLKQLDKESVDCIVTSPPYWALRDYGVEGQLGLEPTFEGYIVKLCNIFDESKRVLKKEGTCWINIGDTYSGSMQGYGATKDSESGFQQAPINAGFYASSKGKPAMADCGLPNKSLCMIPFRFAIEMVNCGWILRNTIIWHKPNCMPSSVKDRFTVDFEYLFFFVKNKKYYFETQYEKLQSDSTIERYKYKFSGNKLNEGRKLIGQPEGKKELTQISPNIDRPNSPHYRGDYSNDYQEFGRNKRTVWTIPTQPFPEAHFAVYPERLIETPIKAGSPMGGVVLDMFMGSGTTGVVSKKLSRNYIGFELNPKYIEIANNRLSNIETPLKVFV